jgi:hypothetical protein
MRTRTVLAMELAHALLAGPWQRVPMCARAAEVLGARPRWVVSVVAACLRRFRHRPPRGAPSELAAYLQTLPALPARTPPVHPVLEASPPSPVRGPWQGAPLPALDTAGGLAAWLGVAPRELLWMAEPWRQRCSEGTARALYRHRWVPKRGGSARLLEVPRPRLRALQRRILDEVLRFLPAHEAAHGFVRGRGVRSFAAPHAGREVVLALDLASFFNSITRARVFRVFRACGYPEVPARLLAGLCTHATPRAELRGQAAEQAHLAAPHLPQGAPTSPALANLCAFRLDVRLAALARAAGATYTRYADDLAFSGDIAFSRGARRFAAQVGAIAIAEGFALQHRKTRRMRACDRQLLAGVVVNARPSVPREAVEQLEATLWNCARTGPAAQNRRGHPDFRAHLLGRIAWVAQLQPDRAAWLRELFERIPWS